MKQVQIKSLTLKYFKGIKKQTVEFRPGQTFISGDNATGKTSIFDAFTWLLFGKDSLGKKEFDIKTLTPDNRPIPQVDHEVEGELMIDGRLVTLRKVYREVWGKTRGEAEVKLLRDETVCYWDGLDILVGEYNRRISDIIPEDLFRLVTDPSYFNKLNTSGKREILISLAGTISNEYLLETRPDLAEIINKVNGSDINDEMRKVANERKRLQDELKGIPGRIDTAYQLMPEEKDWDSIRKRIAEGENQIKAIDAKIIDMTSAGTEANEKAIKLLNEIGAKQREKAELQNTAEQKAQNYNNMLKNEAEVLNRQIENKKTLIYENEAEILRLQSIAKELTQRNETLRTEWRKINETTLQINPDDLACPTCGREYEPEQLFNIEGELTAKFNTRKKASLEDITSEGSINAHRIEDIKKQISELEIENHNTTDENIWLLLKIDENQKTAKAEVTSETTEETQLLDGDINDLQQQLEALKAHQSQPDTTELVQEKNAIQSELNQLNRELGAIEQIERTEKEIANLEKQQRDLSQRVAEIEQMEYRMAELGKLKLSETERLVNEKFQYVQFRLFKFQKNGGEELVCDAMVDGVPFDSLNSAARINAGLDIINALCRYHQINAPVFLDNAESVNKTIETKSQLIKFYVTKDKQLIFN